MPPYRMEQSMPGPHAIATLTLTAVALILFTRERLALETSSLFVLVALLLGFELFPYTHEGVRLEAHEFLLGFGHEALVAVCALMIAGQGLVRTGALEPVGRLLARAWGTAPALSLALTLVVGAVFSAFVNNVPIVVLLLPILVSVSLRTGNAASRVLMPMGFATLLGGMATTIGTSTNLLVVSVAAEMGLERFGMFDFLLPVSIAGGAGLLYLWLIAPRLLPARDSQLGDTSPRVFTAQLLLPEGSWADGRPLRELVEKAGDELPVLRILRGEHAQLLPLPDAVLRAGDRLLLSDTPDRLKEYETVLDGQLWAGDTPVDEDHPLAAGDQQLAEVVVTQGSSLEGATLTQSHFVERYQLFTLALHRPGWQPRLLRRDIRDIRLKVGDIVLVQGSREQIARLKREAQVLVLDATTELPHSDRAPLALAIMAGIVLPAALGWLPIVYTALAGVLLMIATRCLDWRDAAHALSSQVILIVVASLALGKALLATGAADWLAGLFVEGTRGTPPAALLSGLMLLMAIFTNIVSNNAAALIGTPIAIGIARQLGLPEEPFVLSVLFGANMSYATPIAYKTNLLVMSAGGYRFGDFLRVGVPLTLIMWAVFSWLLPQLYPLT
ncbi:Na+:sulfate symporter [endosymbiont of unidentified scaly snail isolate Monju]|nr:Na+:sulfate symporter [endosymbiont of unidentified scaly snail isolate Monju]